MSAPSLPDHPPLRLKDLIKQVRAELEEAVQEHTQSGRPAMFQVEGLTLEINVTVKRDETLATSGEASLYVATLNTGAEKSTGSEVVHKVTVQLSAHKPVGPESSANEQSEPAGFSDAKVQFVRRISKIELTPFNQFLDEMKFTPKHQGVLLELCKNGALVYRPDKARFMGLSAQE